MSLETAFKRLAIQPSTICRQCRRTLATSAQRQQQQGATNTVLSTLLDSQRKQSTTPPRQQQSSPSQLPSTPNSAGYTLAQSSVREATAKSLAQQNRTALADLRRSYTRRDLEAQLPRKYRPGDVYSPHDLSGAEASKWKKIHRPQNRPKFDVLDQLGIDPRKEYKNFSMMGEYMSEVGKIKGGRETGLRPVNQRRMAKAIRRAVGVGLLMPGTYQHPEILRMQMDQVNHTYGKGR